MSLSSSFRKEAHQRYGQHPRRGNAEHAMRGNTVSQSLPSISTKTFAKSIDITLDSPSRKVDTFTRLSGLPDSQSSSGLFAESTQAMRPSIVCVRCGAMHASICVPCSELVCENTLTFYRKTRAAGAAALFNKAFVEAGNSKLVKFFIFRLLRNSFEGRKREQMKMKSVVERMFGQNVVYFPFAAWRRYTRMSILERKDRGIATLEDRVKQLEAQVARLTSENENLHRQNKAFIQDLRQKTTLVDEQKVTITQLQEQKKKDKDRILGLCNLAFPLHQFSSMVDSVLKHESADLRHYLNYAVNNSEAHNYSDVFPETILATSIYNQQELYRVMKPRRPQLHVDVSHKLIIDWLLSVSRSASDHIDPLTGASLDLVLPEVDEVTSIKDLRSGKNLIRAVVALIWEYHKKAMHVINSAPEKAHRRVSAEPPQLLAGEQLSKIYSVKDTPVSLLKICLQLANKSFGVPQFRAMDLASGKVDIIFAFATSLFNVVKPLVNHDEYVRVGKFMAAYENLRSEIWDMFNDKSTLTHFEDLITMWARYHDIDPETGEAIPEEEADDIENSENPTVDSTAEPTGTDENVEEEIGDDGQKDEAELNQGSTVAPSTSSRKELTGNSYAEIDNSNKEKKSSGKRRGNLLDSADKSNTVSKHTAEKIYKPEDMESRYKNLLSAVDLLISNREDTMMKDVAMKNGVINRDFLQLMGKITRWRDERARGMRFSTELRSFITQTFSEKALKFMEYVDEIDGI